MFLVAQDRFQLARFNHHALFPGALAAAEVQPQRTQFFEDALVGEAGEIIERRIEVDVAVERGAEKVARRIDAGQRDDARRQFGEAEHEIRGVEAAHRTAGHDRLQRLPAVGRNRLPSNSGNASSRT